jgi:hypothetical protein
MITDDNLQLHRFAAGNQRTCVICGRRATHECGRCRVVLHIANGVMPCSMIWHSQRNLQAWLRQNESPQSESAASASTSG